MFIISVTSAERRKPDARVDIQLLFTTITTIIIIIIITLLLHPRPDGN